MKKVKISTLPEDTIVLVDGHTSIITVQDILEDLDGYEGFEIYTTIPVQASFNAESIIDSAIENEQDSMYEDWDDKIRADVTKEDIDDIQKIFNRILARSPSQNISYQSDKLIEIDIV